MRMRMRRRPCCDTIGLKKGPWSSDEDELLVQYITKNGPRSWRSLPKLAGLLRCGKSCRLRWINYLRPDIKRGPFSLEEEKLVIQLHAMFGNRWAAIAAKLPGRTDNEIKNLWNTHLKKRLLSMGVDPQTHKPCTISVNWPPTRPPASLSTRHMAQWESTRLKAESRLSKDSLILSSTSTEKIDTDYFLRIWNSEVGQSFRNFNKEGESQSPISQPSSSTKNGSFSGTTMEVGPTVAASQNGDAENKCSKSCTDYSSSDDLEDSSDTALQLLLDSPGSNDMSFLEGDIDNYDIYSGILTESFPLKNGRPYC